MAEYTSSISEWTLFDLELPNPSATYQIAFEGLNNYGLPNVIDLVNVYGEGVLSAPDAVTNLTPVDGAVNIENGSLLNWEFGANTEEYQLMLGTNNPPTTVAVPFSSTLETSYELSDLQSYTQYFWQVNARNTVGTTAGPVWNFTTAYDELYTTVEVTVTLNSGGSPMGTIVKFTNTSEPSLGLVYMINTPQNRGRELLTYKVCLDGEFVADTPDTFYEYDPSSLVQGQEYFTEIAALYTSGMSEEMGYTWTYQPCDSFPGPTQLDYETANLNEVVLNWSGNAPTVGDFYEGFEAGTLPTGWEIYDVDNDGYNWENTHVQFPDFEPHSGLYCMASASYVNDFGPVTPNNWLVTPAIDVTSASKLKFWVGAQDPVNPREWYNVKISTTGNEPEDFTVTLREAWSRFYWAEVIIDLSAYDGQTVYIAFQHMTPPELDMFYIKIDDVTVTNTYTRAAYTAPVASGLSHSIPFKTQNMTQDEIDTRLAAMDNVGFDKPAQNTLDAGGRFDTGEFLGTNIYRNGELIAEKVIAQTYTDQGVAPGIYEYCINYVYTDNAMPCTPLCVSGVGVTGEDCVAPYNLTAEANLTDDGVTLEWEHDTFTGAYLSYGDGVYADAIGLSDFSPITVAIQFDPDTLEAYDGKVFSKINFFYGFGNIGDVSVQVWEGTTLILEEAVSGTIVGETWNEIEFDTPVLIDGSKSYKIGYTVANYDSHPVGVQYYDGNPNSDLIFMDGAWDHISNYLSFAWLLEAYVSNADNADGDYTPLTSKVMNSSDSGVPVSAPYVNLSRGMKGKANRLLQGFNIYRDGELIEALWPETTYTYHEGQGGMVCYTVTAEYEYCGETDPSNEACVVLVGVNDIEVSDIRIYPNPSNSFVNIELSSNINRVQIYNYLGECVFENKVTKQTMLKIDVRQYDAGAYLVRFITNDGQSHTKKVMVNQ